MPAEPAGIARDQDRAVALKWACTSKCDRTSGQKMSFAVRKKPGSVKVTQAQKGWIAVGDLQQGKLLVRHLLVGNKGSGQAAVSNEQKCGLIREENVNKRKRKWN